MAISDVLRNIDAAIEQENQQKAAADALARDQAPAVQQPAPSPADIADAVAAAPMEPVNPDRNTSAVQDLGTKLNIGTTVAIPEQIVGIGQAAANALLFGGGGEGNAATRFITPAFDAVRKPIHARREELTSELSAPQQAADKKEFLKDNVSWENLSKDGVTGVPGKIIDAFSAGEVFGEGFGDWDTFARKSIGSVTESLPGTVATMGPTFKLAGMAAKQAVKEGAKTITDKAVLQKLGEKAAERTAMIVGGIGEGLQGAGAGYEGTLQKVRETKIDDKLRANPNFIDALSEVSRDLPQPEREKAALEILANRAATISSAGAFAFDSVFGAVGDKFIGSAAAGKGTRVGSIGRGVASETPAEGIQSMGEAWSENLGIKATVDPDQLLAEGIGEQGLSGAISGGLMGAGMGAAFHSSPAADKGADPGALARNLAVAQLERSNLPTRDLIAIRNGDFEKVPHALDLVQKLGITPEHIDSVLENRYRSMTDAQISLANDINQGPLVRAASMAAEQTAFTLGQEKARKATQAADDAAAIENLMATYNPTAPKLTEQGGRTVWPATDKTPAIVSGIEDRKMQGEWDKQETDAALNLAGRFQEKKEAAPTQEKADPLAAQKAAFQESYDAAGTVPASEGNISKEDADKFEAKATQERKAKQHREWLAGHKKKMADVEATLKDKAVPVEVLKAAQAEADKIVATDPVYQHMEEAKKRGKINLDAMRQTYGKEMTRQITQRYPGIFSLVGTVNPDEFAQEMGYGKADEMINRFSEARTKKELAAQFVKEKVGEWEQAQSDQDDYFTGMAERQQGAEEWVGPQSATKPLRTVFPAPDEAVTAMESMIRRKPENFTEDDLDHWTYTAEQQGRLRKAYREATDGQREVPGDTQASPGESKPEGRTEPVAEVDQEAAGLDTLPATPEQGVAAPAGDKSTPIDTAVDTAATGTQVLSGQVTSDNTEQVQQNEGGVAQSATTVTPQGGVADETGETRNNQADDYTQAQLKQLLADLKEKRKQQGTVTDDRLEKQIRDIEKLIEGEAAEVVSSEMEPATPTVKESLTVDPTTEQSSEVDAPTVKLTAEEELAAISDEDLASMMDDVFGEAEKPAAPKAPTKPRLTAREKFARDIEMKGAATDPAGKGFKIVSSPSDDGSFVLEVVNENGIRNTIGRPYPPGRGYSLQEVVDKAIEMADFTPRKTEASPSSPPKEKAPKAIVKEGGIAALGAVQDAMNGLSALFGSKNRLGSGLSFDEDSYAAAKPHFVSAWNEAKQFGYSLKELVQHFHKEFGDAIRPFLERFLRDVKSGDLTTGESDSTVNQGDKPDTNTEGEPDDNDTRGSVPTDGESTRDVDETDPAVDAATPEGVEAEGVRGTKGNRPPSTRNTKGGRKGAKGDKKPDGLWDTVPRGPGDDAETLHPEGAGTGNDRGDGKGVIPAVNFRITDEVGLGEGSENVKYKDNVAAIKLLKDLIRESRRATGQEQRVLARYVGWGGMANAFKNKITGEVKAGWEDKVAEIADLLTAGELSTAASSTRNAHYTSKDVVDAMWRAVGRLGFKGGNVLEPSSGTGNFIGLVPESISRATNFMAVEFDGITAGIAKNLYPQAAVFHSGFEKLPLPSGSLDLVIGNPPFGAKGHRLHFQYSPHLNGLSIHNQFFLAGIDALKPGGIQAMVVSRYMLDSQDTRAREMIGDKAKFLGAIRLPQSAFQENARTTVITDIVFLQKRTVEEQAVYDGTKPENRSFAETEWLGTGTVRDPLGGEPMTVNRYFANNPEAIVGVMDRSGSQHQGDDITVKVPAGASIGEMIDTAVSRVLPQDVAMQPTIQEKAQRQFDSLVTGMEVALAGHQSGQVSRSKEGALIHTFDMETAGGDIIMQTRTLSPESPWHGELEMDENWNWFRVTDVIDKETGKPAKVVTAAGKVTNRNQKGREVFEGDSKVPENMRLGANKFQQMGAVVDLLGLLKTQINLESSDKSTEAEVEGNRNRLKKAYDRYVEKYGPTNGPSTASVVKDMPDQSLIYSLEKSYTKAVSKDKAKKLGIESRKDSAEMTTILTRRAIPLYKAPEGFAQPEDALGYILSETGVVDMAEIARLYGKTEDETLQALQDRPEPLVFKNPETGVFESADEYLSGNVSRKVTAARDAMSDENRTADYSLNIAALEKVLPEPWTSDKVTVVLGATWFDPSVYADFLSSLTGHESRVQFNKLSNSFVVSGSATGPQAVQWGTQRMDASRILDNLLNNKAFRVYDHDDDGRHLNEEESLLAKSMSENIRQEFERWVMQDSERRNMLTTLYNQKYNVRSNRQRSGQHLQMPGKVPDAVITMRRHQKNGIWRGIVDRFVLYDHAVGSGKTFTGIARAMERKRMGISRKPMIVVPNHLVEQFAADVYRLYPGANLLAMGKKDLEGKKRRRAFAKMATGDYDVIIMPHSSFEFIGIDPATETRYLQAEIDIALQMLAQAEEEARDEGWEGGSFRKPLTVKKAEAAVTHLEGKMEKLRARGRSSDRLLTFEQIGVDDLTIDEAHEFKNLFYASNLTVKGMNDRQGSAKAYNLWSKVRTLREQPRGSVAFMTGTPISNSAVEMYILTKYLGAEMLAEGDIEHFDAWFPQFTTTSTEFEFDPTGGSLKETTRLGREWANMRNLMSMYRTFADSVTNEDLQAQYAADNPGKKPLIPVVKGGGRQAVEVDATPAQLALIEGIIDRYDNLDGIQDLRERSSERLRLMDLAKKASLDARAVDPRVTSDEKGGKLDVIAGKVADIYTEWTADKGTQLIFLDRGIPKGKGDAKEIQKYDDLVAEINAAMRAGDEDKVQKLNGRLDKFDRNEIEEMRASQSTNWSAYQQLKDNLIARGIPEKEIRFVQDANTDLQKAELFEEVNAGTVRVLIGSTKKMGAGTNVQQRLVALHHGDVTYKPSDIEQREGRIIRQGNLFNTPPTDAEANPLYRPDFEVIINAYVTKRTVDAPLWDLNSQKMKMINGIRKYNGEFNMEFDDDESVSMKQIAALASGDPLQLERVKLISETHKLHRLASAHQRSTWGAQDMANRAQRDIDELPGRITFTRAARATLTTAHEALGKHVEARQVTVGDGRTYTHATKAGAIQEVEDAKKLRDETKGKFALTVDGVDYKSVDKAEDAIHEALGDDNAFLATFNGTDYTRRINLYRAVTTLANDKIGPAMLKQAGAELPRMREEKLGTFSYRGAEFEISVEVDSERPRDSAKSKAVATKAIFTLVGTIEGKRMASYYSQDITRTPVEKALPNNPPRVRVTLSGMFKDPDLTIDGLRLYGRSPEAMESDLQEAKDSLPEYEKKAQEPFAKQAELDEKEARLSEVERTLAAQSAAGQARRQDQGAGNQQQQDPDPSPQLSRSAAVPEANRADVEQEITAAIGGVRARRLTRNGSVVVLDSQQEANDLIDKATGASVKYSKDGAIQGVYLNGTTYLVKDGIAKGQAFPVLLHEMGEHAAKLGMSTDAEYQNILASLKKRKDSAGATGEAIRAAIERVPADTKPEHYWSEVAAYLVENEANKKLSIVDRLLNFFKKWLIKAGITSPDTLSHKDLVLFAQAAVRAASGPTGTGPGGKRSVRASTEKVSDNFTRWFGKSKITRDGQPIALFHGTRDPHFLKKQEYPWIFDTSRPKNPENSNLSGLGIFLGGMNAAEAHAGMDGTVHPFYVKMESPYVTTAAALEKKVEASGTEAFRKRLQELNGHDGIIITDRGHVIVFSPNQVKSATANTGAFSSTNNDVRYSRAGKQQAETLKEVLGEKRAAALAAIENGGFTAAMEQEYFQAMAKEGEAVEDVNDASIATKARDWFKSLPKATGRKVLGGMTLRQMREVFAKDMPQMGDFYQATRDQDADAKKIMTKADEVYNQWVDLPKAAAKDMAELMIKATVAEVNPDTAEFEPRANTRAFKKRIAEKTARLVEIKDEMAGVGDMDKLEAEKTRLEYEIKGLAEKVEHEVGRYRDYQELAPAYRALSKEAKEVYQAVKKQYTDNLEELFSALSDRLARQVKDPKMRKQTMDAIRLQYDKYLEKGPYFPLSRFGDYVTIAERDGQREVRTFDTLAERTRYTRGRRADGWAVQSKTSREFSRETAGASSHFVEGIFDILEKNSTGIPVAQLAMLKDQVNQHFIQAMPDLSHRKHFAHRQKVEGYSRDQMRAFAANQQHAAHHIARIRHADKMEAAVTSILAESKMLSPDQDGDDYTDLYNELVKRLEILNNPDISPVTQAITAAGFVWNIGPSIASAVVNISQTPLVAFPILATRFKKTGSISAMKALTKASADYFTSKPRLASGPSLIDNKKLPQHERDMIQALIDDGTIDVTAAHSLAQAAGNDYLNLAKTAHGSKALKVMRLVSYPFHIAELANRKVTALAAYRLALENGMTRQEAVAETREAVLDSHFDYCVDSETECLTSEGWKRHTELVPGKSKVFAVDDRGTMVASELLDLHVFNSGNHKVTEFSNSNGFSMVVTPNHTNIVQTYGSRRREWSRIKKVKTSDLKNHHFIVRAPQMMVDDENFTERFTDDEIRLITWIAADGWYAKYRNCKEKTDVRIGQSETSASGNPQELRDLLSRFGDIKEYTYDRTNKNSKDRFTTFVLPRSVGKIVQDAMPNKELTFDLINGMSLRQQKILLDLFLDVDGHEPKEGGRLILQKSISNLECLQFIATALGFSTSISKRGDHHILNIMSATKRSYVKEMSRVDTEVDLVWCPETAHGTWIARRNGRVFVTGNSQSNRARWMEGNVRRVVFLFKQYSQQMTWLLGRSYYLAAKGESPEVKAEAKKRLAMILGGHILVSGLQGMPVLGSLVGLVQFLVASMGDEDEPEEIAVTMRNILADTVGQKAGDALVNGPWRLIPGLGNLDIASRVSLGDLWLRMPDKEAEGKDKFNQYVNLVLGPIGNNAANIFMGFSTMADGNTWRGVETMLPKFLKDGMKAVRYARDGVQNWKEDTLIDNLDTMDIFGQALGFTPTRISEMYSGANAVKNHERRLNARRQVLVNRWVQATRKGDAEQAASIMADIIAFNSKQPIFSITGDSLKQSYRNRIRTQGNTVDGVYLPATKDDIRKIGRFADPR